jgi:hypothetical protein
MCDQGVNILEESVTITALEFGSVYHGFAMSFQRLRAWEDQIAIWAKAVSCSDKVVLKDIQSFTYFTATAAVTGLAIAWNYWWVVARRCAPMRRKVTSSYAMLLQIN